MHITRKCATTGCVTLFFLPPAGRDDTVLVLVLVISKRFLKELLLNIILPKLSPFFLGSGRYARAVLFLKKERVRENPLIRGVDTVPGLNANRSCRLYEPLYG